MESVVWAGLAGIGNDFGLARSTVNRPFSLPLEGRGRTGELLAALGPMLAAGGRVYCLDAGNMFNPLGLARGLRSAGIDPVSVLAGQVFVSRAFTCHQLAGAVRTMLFPLLRDPCPPPALLLGVDHLFLDEDIPLFERQFLFDRILADAAELARRGMPLLITCGSELDNAWARQLKGKTLPVSFRDPAAGHLEVA